MHHGILEQIRSCHPPTEGLRNDSCSCKRTINGNFKVKSAYQALVLDETVDEDKNWKLIWGQNVLPRVKNLIWLVRI